MSVRRRLLAAGGAALVAGALTLSPVLCGPVRAATVATPTVTSTTPASPSTSTTPSVKGTAPSGSTVTLYSSSSCSSAIGSGSASSFTGSTGITVTVQSNATTKIYAKARLDQSSSSCSSSFVTYVNDKSAPGAVTLSGTTPTSPSSSKTPTIKGTAETGSTVRLYTTAGCTGTVAGSGTASTFGSAGIRVTVATGSTTTFRATATDPAGNTSTCSTSSLTYTNDTTAPPVVTLSSVAPSSPNPSTAPVVKGTAEAGAAVKIYTTTGCSGSPAITTTAAALAAGVTVPVVVGTTSTFRAIATDQAGNSSACSTSSLSYTSDLPDGGFEAGTGGPIDSPYWFEADSLAGSPLCNLASCTTGDGLTAPHSGSGWAWFGGFAEAGHTGSLTQVLTIPVGTKSLTYWYLNGSVSAPYDAQLRVLVDGTTIKTHIEAAVADTAYAQQFANLAPFADGKSHTLTFAYANGGEGVNNMVVDDVHLSAASATATPVPIVTATLPGSTSTSTTPMVTGTAATGTSVQLYGDSSCSGSSLGTGTAAAFASTGIAVSVPIGTTTTIFARATKASQYDSACSTTSVSYTQQESKPETVLTKTPKKKVTTRKARTKVTFAFASATPGVHFECRLDGKKFKPCVSGKKLKVKPGKHSFAVRAVLGQVSDPTPATYVFRVKKKR